MKQINIKNKLITVALITLAGAITQSAMAKSIDGIQANQKQRISQGVSSGELTGKEAWRLGKQQKKIYMKERRFKSDGNFTRRERGIIRHDLLKSSGSIYKQKHDRQKQGAKAFGIKSKGINKRQRSQTKRIAQGVRSGSLTRGEAVRLGKQQRRIQHKKRAFKSDGHFGKRERARIHHLQNKSSRNIFRKKHNAKHR